jgi:hypothetical protein
MRDEMPLRLMIAAYIAFLLVLLLITIALARRLGLIGRGTKGQGSGRVARPPPWCLCQVEAIRVLVVARRSAHHERTHANQADPGCLSLH